MSDKRFDTINKRYVWTNATSTGEAPDSAKYDGSTAIDVRQASSITVEVDASGIDTAIVLANSLKTVTNAHAADAAEHTGASGADTVNYPVATENAKDFDSLMTLAGALLTAYDEHDADAEAGTPVYHEATETGDHSLASEVQPTTVVLAITRLVDLKTKYNAHDADANAHDTGSQHQESTADASKLHDASDWDLNVLGNFSDGLDFKIWQEIDTFTATANSWTAVNVGPSFIKLTVDKMANNRVDVTAVVIVKQ